MDSTSQPNPQPPVPAPAAIANPQPPVPATIDIPQPAAWRLLPHAATVQDYGWRQPHYNAHIAKMPFDADFARIISENPRLPFGFHFALAAGTTEELERLADFRQTRFEGKPLKDGSNLVQVTTNPITNHQEVNGGLNLLHMYNYMKDVLQWLYRNNIVELQDYRDPATGEILRRFSGAGLTGFTTLLRSGTHTAYTHEKTRLQRRNDGPQYALGFEWVEAYKMSVIDGIMGIQAAKWWAEEYNYDPIPHMQMAINSIPPITRLILYLLNREKAFNDLLAREHIEDILHDKRINWFNNEDMFTMGEADALDRIRRLDAALKPFLVDWQRRMRACFDYRMLRDWGYGRHWKKMYLVFDVPAGSEERAAIEMFKRWASNNGKLAYEMFGVHPMNKDEIPDGDICSICYCAWESTELVLDLHCGHRFHPNCIFRHWDNVNHFSNPCANCRMSNGWLKDRMDFEAQKKDVDYTVDQGAMATADGHYRYGISTAIEQNWPGGIEAGFRPNDGHHECYWRTVIQMQRTRLREERYTLDPTLGELDGKGS